MTIEQFRRIIREIVKESLSLKDKRTTERGAPVNYAAVFAQSNKKYLELYELAQQLGKVIKNTLTGDLFDVGALNIMAGKLRLIKIRKTDTTRPERGDADFAILDSQASSRLTSLRRDLYSYRARKLR